MIEATQVVNTPAWRLQRTKPRRANSRLLVRAEASHHTIMNDLTAEGLIDLLLSVHDERTCRPKNDVAHVSCDNSIIGPFNSQLHCS